MRAQSMQDPAALPTEPSLVSQRYRILHLIGVGGMGRVYCAHDRLTGKQVALKHLQFLTVPTATARDATARTLATTAAERPTTLGPTGESTSEPHVYVRVSSQEDSLRQRLALENEFRTLGSLRHPSIVSVLDYGFDSAEGPYLTMELLAHAAPFQHDPAVSLAEQVALLAQMLHALSYLHRHHIIHRDLKPANALVVAGPQGRVLKLLDFGLALTQDEAAKLHAGVSGTFGYMAPEILLGAPPSAAADLFAVGAIAYEVLSGRAAVELPDSYSPFKLATQPIDPRPMLPFGPLGELVMQLLSSEPEARGADALAVLSTLAASTRRPELNDDTGVRDSFLLGARFVGRESECYELQGALERCLTGRSETWLIGGESGIGKSRLLDELRRHALVREALVARGQAVASGGAAYQVYHDALRLICLHAAPSDFAAGVLKALIPDLDALLERPIPEVPQLDAPATQLRLRNILEQVLRLLPMPLVLLLEDLHWADAESLALLKYLSAELCDRPILIVATYRNDEAPALPAKLPTARVLTLGRLGSRSIALLTESMLGKAGRRADLLALIERESEGNTFFLTEVVRTLAAEAGRLAWIAKGPLPQRVLSGGVRAVLERRLAAVPQWAHSGLTLAAVLGRQLDLAVLAHLVPESERFLRALADAAVLEVRDDSWRFCHDKLREFLLEKTPAAAAREAHRSVAAAIAAAYPGAALLPYSAALAEHYTAAGDLAQAATFRVQAAKLAQSQGALEAAALHCRAALQADKQTPLSPLCRIRALRILAQALFGLRRSDECLAVYTEEYQDLKGGSLKGLARLVAAVVGEAVEQSRHLLSGGKGAAEPPSEPSRTLLREQFFFTSLGVELLVLRGRRLGPLRGLLRCLNLADASADNALRAIASAGFAYALTLLGQSRLAGRYAAQADCLIRSVQDPVAALEVRRILGLLYMGRGEFVLALAELAQALQLAEELGHEEGRMFCLASLITVSRLRGDHQKTLALCPQLDGAATRAGHLQYLAGVRMSQAWIALGAGQLDAAHDLLVQSELLTRQMNLPVTTMVCSSYWALLAARREEFGEALQRADQTLLLAAGERSTGPGLLIPAWSLFTALMAVLAAPPAPEAAAERRRQQAVLRRIAKTAHWMRMIVKRFPVGTARLALLTGQLHERAGRPAAAQRAYERALHAATRFGLEYDVALAHLFLGRLASAARQGIARWHLESAAAGFARLGASGEAGLAASDLARARQSGPAAPTR